MLESCSLDEMEILFVVYSFFGEVRVYPKEQFIETHPKREDVTSVIWLEIPIF
jgi:hypothetical protein